MQKYVAFILVILLQSAALPGLAAEPTLTPVQIDALLDKADKLRIGNLSLFEQHLAQLNGYPGPLTLQQQNKLRYLNAIASYIHGDTEAAESAFKQLIAQHDDMVIQLRATLSLANIYGLAGDQEGAFALLLDINEPRYASIPEPLRVYGLSSAAYLYAQAGLYKQADELYRWLPEAGAQTDITQRCLDLALGIELDLRLGRMPTDLGYKQLQRQQCHDAGELISAATADTFVAQNLLEHGNPAKAKELLEQTLAVSKSTRYANLLGYIYAILAKTKAQLGESDVLATAEQALSYANTSQLVEGQVIAYEAMADALYAGGQFEQALHYMQLSLEAYQQSVDQQRSSAMAYYMVRLRHDQERLQQLDQQVQQMAHEQQLAWISAENRSLYITVLVLALAICAGWIIRYRKERGSLRNELQFDALTTVYSRRHGTRMMTEMLSYKGAQERPVTLLLLDLDHFKHINDQFGHPCGDAVLEQVGRLLLGVSRQGDPVVRMGGEEFCILLPDCDGHQAHAIAEKYRHAVEHLQLPEEMEQLSLSVSIGVAASCQHGYNFTTLFAAADKALYLAKENGRNRVVAEPLPELV